MSALMVAPTAIEMAKELTHLGVKADVMIQPNDGGANIVALQNYMRTYFPPTEVVYFAIELLASTHSFFRAKQMGDEEFRRYLFSTLMTRKNKRVHALPACIQEVPGGVFVLCGPSGAGKTAFWVRYVARLPKPFVLKTSMERGLESLAGIWVIPVVHISYPVCGTVKGLARDLRDHFVRIIDDVRNEEDEFDHLPPLPDMLAGEPMNAVINACVSLNVGLFVLDGAGIRHSNTQSYEVLEFLLKLREKGGVPVALSCTAAFLKSIEHLETTYANLTNSTMINLEPIPAPSPKPSPGADGKTPPDFDVFRQMCRNWWAAGLLGRKSTMPDKLEYWIHEITQGNNRFTATAHYAIQKYIATNCAAAPESNTPYTFNTAALSRDIVETVIRQSLFGSKGALTAIATAMNLPSSDELGATPVISTDILNYVDYLPTSQIQKQRISAWVTPQQNAPRKRRK
ncbi:ATP-binding protein [Herbaspirillum camelliae]|uniref:ATP-binding protein n=1 Tax=Herbaspirillum camelliae TaxID=1892903 RepID=UPI001E649DB2|nr:ATP-binding protein [Herbaspirillum camelliae]